MQHMADHIERGFSDDEALILGVAEIRQQIRGAAATWWRC